MLVCVGVYRFNTHIFQCWAVMIAAARLLFPFWSPQSFVNTTAWTPSSFLHPPSSLLSGCSTLTLLHCLWWHAGFISMKDLNAYWHQHRSLTHECRTLWVLHITFSFFAPRPFLTPHRRPSLCRSCCKSCHPSMMFSLLNWIWDELWKSCKWRSAVQTAERWEGVNLGVKAVL